MEIETIITELKNQQNVRANLSRLRALLKELPKEMPRTLSVPGRTSPHERAAEQQAVINGWGDLETDLQEFLHSDDAKTRKNAALLLGDLQSQNAVEALFSAYEQEQTRFVRGAYLQALFALDNEQKLLEPLIPAMKIQLAKLLAETPAEDAQKHVEEEIRALRRILIRYEGITRHTFEAKGQEVKVLLTGNRRNREFIHRNIPVGRAAMHPLGILVETNELHRLLQYRLYREVLFPITLEKGNLLPNNPKEAAEALWNSDFFRLLNSLHKENGKFYFRVELRSPMTLEERSDFAKKLSAYLEQFSGQQLINSTSDYEVELRLIANKNGRFFPCMKLASLKDRRFAYRKNVVASSIQPSTAALLWALAEPYLREHAQVLDPFCGVGTMLIERSRLTDVHDVYGIDLYGEAVEKARENTRLAGLDINYIHRDFMGFTHTYQFDEIVANMPVQGKKTKEELGNLYASFFSKIPEILKQGGRIFLYTNEVGLVKKQLRFHPEIRLLQEFRIQDKGEYDWFIMELE